MTDELSKLSWVRLFVPKLIPEELILAVKGRTFTPKAFYEYQVDVKDWPGNFLYVLIDDDKKIQGFLWAELNNMDGSIFVNTFSVRKEYWHKGKTIEKAIELLLEIKDRCKSPNVYWLTTNPKFFEKHGFTRSKNVLMEYNPEKREKDDGTE